MKADAAKLSPLVTSELAKEFLAATAKLTEPAPRTVYRNREKGIALSKRAYDALPAEEKAALTPRECPPNFYYETGYGSPLVYARVLDLAAPHITRGAKLPPRVLDFGYGTIGQLHLLARCGFDAHGVDVEPMFPALYSEPGDTGAMGTGSASIHVGQWPAEESLRNAIGGGYALITSKNTLKKGYIHPSPPVGQTVDPKRLVHLGVSDEEFLSRVHDALEPRGVFLIYNICPPQNPPTGGRALAVSARVAREGRLRGHRLRRSRPALGDRLLRRAWLHRRQVARGSREGVPLLVHARPPQGLSSSRAVAR
jgi:hypothetical protein